MAIEVNGSAVSNVNYNGNTMCGVIEKATDSNGRDHDTIPFLRECFKLFGGTAACYGNPGVNYRFWVPASQDRVCYCWRYCSNCSNSLIFNFSDNKYDGNFCCNQMAWLSTIWQPLDSSLNSRPKIWICGRDSSTCSDCCYSVTLNYSTGSTFRLGNCTGNVCNPGTYTREVGITDWCYGCIMIPSAIAHTWYYSGTCCCGTSCLCTWEPTWTAFRWQCDKNCIKCYGEQVITSTINHSQCFCVCIG